MRWQLPAHSPLTLRGIAGAGLDVLAGRDPRSALEALLRDRFSADQVVLTDSGTHALQSALAAVARHAPGRPVALPAYTCFDVATAALGARVPVMFYDLELPGLVPDAAQVRGCLESGCAAVVVNSLYGFPVDWGALRRVCDAFGALLVEDAAQGVGSGWEGQPGGSFGDASILSFGRGKGWTGGAGGALLWRGRAAEAGPPPPSPPASAGARALVVSAAQWVLGRPALFGLPRSIPGLGLGETHFHAPTPPVGIPAYAAASVLRHGAAAESEGAVRRRNAAAWTDMLDEPWIQEAGITFCRPLDEALCGYLRFPVVASGAARAVMDRREVDRIGVARGYPIALPDLPGFGDPAVGPLPDVPVARALATALRTLPTHSKVSRGDLRRFREACLKPLSL